MENDASFFKFSSGFSEALSQESKQPILHKSQANGKYRIVGTLRGDHRPGLCLCASAEPY